MAATHDAVWLVDVRGECRCFTSRARRGYVAVAAALEPYCRPTQHNTRARLRCPIDYINLNTMLTEATHSVKRVLGVVSETTWRG